MDGGDGGGAVTPPSKMAGPRMGAADRLTGVIYGPQFFDSIWRVLYNPCGSQKPAAYITPVIDYPAVFCVSYD